MSLQPVAAAADFDEKRNAKIHRALHFAFHDFGNAFDFIDRRIEKKFVVDLENHFRLEPFSLQRIGNAYHRNLYEIRRGTLHWRIDGVAFGGLAGGCILRIDVAQRSPAAKNRNRISRLARFRYGRFHERLYFRIETEIRFDEIRGLPAQNTESLRKAECGNPVNDSDLCEGYTYDDATKIITLNCIETTDEMVKLIKIVKCDENSLQLDFDGEIRVFTK